MRSRRERKQRIIITGVGGRLGRALTRRLHRHAEVIGIDRRAVTHLPKDVAVERADIRRRKFEDVFRREKIDAVVHLNIMHDPRQDPTQHHDFNIIGTKKVFELCAEHRVPKVVVLSSADVYGPDPRNPQFLKEDAPLLGGQSFGAIRDLIALDMFCNTFFWRYPEIETVILRPVHIVGQVDNAPSRYLRLERPLTLMGFDPMIQLIHVEDVLSVIEKALIPGVRGVYNIAGPSPVPLSFIHKKLGRTPRPIPEVILRAMLKAGWSLKMSDWPWPELAHIKYVCMVDDSAARRELGFEPSYTIDQIIDDIRTRPID